MKKLLDYASIEYRPPNPWRALVGLVGAVAGVASALALGAAVFCMVADVRVASSERLCTAASVLSLLGIGCTVWNLKRVVALVGFIAGLLTLVGLFVVSYAS